MADGLVTPQPATCTGTILVMDTLAAGSKAVVEGPMSRLKEETMVRMQISTI